MCNASMRVVVSAMAAFLGIACLASAERSFARAGKLASASHAAIGVSVRDGHAAGIPSAGMASSVVSGGLEASSRSRNARRIAG